MGKRISRTLGVAAVLMSISSTAFAAQWHYLGGTYFTTGSSSAGSYSSGDFARPGYPMYTCGDVSASTGNRLDIRLVREISWAPDTTQRGTYSYYRDPAVCTSPGFSGSAGETYYTHAIWEKTSTAYDGWAHTKYYK